MESQPPPPTPPAWTNHPNYWRGVVALLILCGVGVWGVVKLKARRNQQQFHQPSTVVEEDALVLPEGMAIFKDVVSGSGIDFTYRNGDEADRYTILETLGGGVGLIDYDRDGRLDVILPGGGTFSGPDKNQIVGHRTRLYRNLGDWEFEDVTEHVGVEATVFYSHGCAVADYDRDGWSDFLITGYEGLALYHNEPSEEGGRRFVNITEAAGLPKSGWNTSAGWGDCDGDGDPDLYICRYVAWSLGNDVACTKNGVRDVCPPDQFEPQRHLMLENLGDSTFRDATSLKNLRADGSGLGVILADLDADRQPDIYVANDAAENHLYLNQRGILKEVALSAGANVDEHGLANGSRGVDAGDYDGSGRASLWVTNFDGETHSLYRNVGRASFRNQSHGSGIVDLGRRYVGFGTGFLDFDSDGWLDLFIANGHVQRHPRGGEFRQRPLLLRNTAVEDRRMFRNVSESGGDYFSRALLGRGVAIGDLDNDGRADVVVSHSNSPVAFLRNTLANETHWLGIELSGRRERDVVGSTVSVQLLDRRLVRFAIGGGSYLSSSDRRLLFGLGTSATIERVTVDWSWGESQTWKGLEVDAYYRLTEGSGEVERAPRQ